MSFVFIKIFIIVDYSNKKWFNKELNYIFFFFVYYVYFKILNGKLKFNVICKKLDGYLEILFLKVKIIFVVVKIVVMFVNFLFKLFFFCL